MEKVNVLYASSQLYLPIAYVSMLSAIDNLSTDVTLRIFFVYTDININDLRLLEENLRSRNVEIVLIDGEGVFDIIKENRLNMYNGNYMNLVKMFVSEFVPRDVENLLWIDCDTLIMRDISGINDVFFGDMPMGMVLDTMRKEYKKHILGSDKDMYFNSGIVLFNMPNWRKYKCKEALVSYMQNFKCHLLGEQDIFNIVFRNQILKLPCEYNFITPMIMHNYSQLLKVYSLKSLDYYSKEEYENARKNPIIVHCAGDGYGRPWCIGSRHPYKNIFDKYAKDNLFDFQEWDKKIPIHYRIQRWFKENTSDSIFEEASKLINIMISLGLCFRDYRGGK